MAKLLLGAAGITASFAILLTAAAAQDAALLRQAQEIFPPLLEDLARAGLPTTKERVELGRSLFFDPRLTIDGNMSCSSCHQPAFYVTDARPKSIGVQQRPHPHNAPTVLNSGALNIIHWVGDRDSLEDQVAKAATSRSHPVSRTRKRSSIVCRRWGVTLLCSRQHFQTNRNRRTYRTSPRRSAPMSVVC